MNQAQVKYAKQRAEGIRAAKLGEINGKYFTPAKLLTGAQKIEALRKGEFTVDESLDPRYYWYNCIKFNNEQLATTDQKAIAKERAAVESAFTKLMDELILGDNEQALKLLAAFEAL